MKPAAIAVFSKIPIPGQVKTRLQGRLGVEGCLSLQRALLFDSVDRIATLGASTYLYLAGSDPKELQRFRDDARLPESVRTRLQRGSDLGERLHDAFRLLLRTHRRALIVGADAPTVPLQHLREGLASLNRTPVVIGPAADGGYYAIGMSELRSSLFHRIDWGGDDVFRQTMARLEPEKATILPEWYDVDRIDDLSRLRHELRELPADRLPRLRAALQDLEDLLPGESE